MDKEIVNSDLRQCFIHLDPPNKLVNNIVIIFVTSKKAATVSGDKPVKDRLG